MRFAVVALTFLSVVLPIPAGAGTEPPILVRVEVADRMEAREVGRILNLDERTRSNVLFGWGTAKDVKTVEGLGYFVEVVPLKPKDTRALTMCPEPFDPPFPWDCYPTWAQYEEMLAYYVATYPEITELVNLGMSGQGDHELWALKISDPPPPGHAEEDEPEVLYTGTMHGDELVCYPTTVHLIDDILSNYGSDAQVTRLVDETVLWINPMSNPDGTFAGGDHTVSGAGRYLPASGVDANRSFPDPSVPDDITSSGWPTEVQVMMDFAAAEHITIAANCHSGAELFNYPWDVWYTRTPDDQWWIDAGVHYATLAQDASPAGYFVDYGSGFDMPGVSNGANWYVIDGGRQDFMNWYHGAREVTLELSGSKAIDAGLLDDHFDWNRQSLLDYFDLALTGIRGVVTDAQSGDPVAAEVRVIGHDSETHRSWVTTDPDVGDYHRLIEPGTYDLEVTAPGFETGSALGVYVPPNGPGVFATLQDFALIPLPRFTVTGLVTDAATGAPIEGASVSVVGTSFEPAETDASGAYSLPGVWEGTFTFRVAKHPYRAVEVELAVGPGSTVLDFEMVAPYLVIETDFEISDGGMTSSGGWAWGTDAVTGAHSGSQVWGTALNGDYADEIDWTLDSPAIDLTGVDGAELRFWQWYEIEGNGYDGGNLKVAVDGGAFSLVAAPVPAYNDAAVNGLNGAPGYNGSAGWHEVVVDLSSFAGHSVQVRWTLGTDYSQVRRGWYLDDLSVIVWGGEIVPPLFADGFEDGTINAWSTVAG